MRAYRVHELHLIGYLRKIQDSKEDKAVISTWRNDVAAEKFPARSSNRECKWKRRAKGSAKTAKTLKTSMFTARVSMDDINAIRLRPIRCTPCSRSKVQALTRTDV